MAGKTEDRKQEKPPAKRKRDEPCPTCGGRGLVAVGTLEEHCATCDGTGKA